MYRSPTVLVSAQRDEIATVMAAAWTCVLDYGQKPKVTILLDQTTRTRELVEASCHFVSATAQEGDGDTDPWCWQRQRQGSALQGPTLQIRIGRSLVAKNRLEQAVRKSLLRQRTVPNPRLRS